ncbi:hypothetical protein BW727_100271 [Jeotgalibaca dankookensis]|uniref:ATPase AAA-type core domain-containing protein n=2 Tax=Jeotgalibaca dankookensis TaxID=708126 RepID=A0A1S6IMD5_9LACT|nr:hypothetical protein BW727_100271 [Jeotgalibaca dankookensis]
MFSRPFFAILIARRGGISMLVELVVDNFYSFRDEITFSMIGTHIPEHPHTLEETNIFPLNKVSTIYGANASGKSNLLKAIAVIQEGLFIEPGQEAEWFAKIKPFHLDAQSELKETLLEISFLCGESLYRYGFFASRKEITEEYLYIEKNANKPETIFHRLTSGPQPQRLWMTEQLLQMPLIKKWFHNMHIILQPQKNELTISKTKFQLKKNKEHLLSLIQIADPSIYDIEIRQEMNEEGHFDDAFYVIKQKRLLDGSVVPIREGFLFQDVESTGTVKLLALAGPIIEALEKGSLLMVDEMDQSFHTLMTRYILELFRGKANKKGAQLVFSTHDISNLRSELFRRDQVWFVEKDREGNSHLESLVAFKFDDSERKNSYAFYQNYLNGKYGAVPYLPPADWWADDGQT